MSPSSSPTRRSQSSVPADEENGEMNPLLNTSSPAPDNNSTNTYPKTTRRILRWILPRVIAAVLLGQVLYRLPPFALELDFFPAHGKMMPAAFQGTVVDPSMIPLSPNITRFPERVHVTYKSLEALPPAWKESLEEWKRLHPTRQVQFWSDEDIDEFVAKEYPEYVDLFARYPYKIQQVDAVRYMILLKHGGIYSDLDIYPARNLEGLLAYFEDRDKDVVLAKTLNAGLTNALMMAAPNSDFMKCVVKHLPEHQTRWYHIIGWRHWTVLSSAGSTFLWGMYGHCGTSRGAVLATDSFRRCSVCDSWQSSEVPTSDWCDTDFFKHTSENSSWHGRSLFHQAWFLFAMTLFCHIQQSSFVISLALIILIPRIWCYCNRRCKRERQEGQEGETDTLDECEEWKHAMQLATCPPVKDT